MRRDLLMPALHRALGRLARSERGFAVPTVLMIIIAGLGLASATIVASIATQKGSTRDQHVKEALAAADAGLQVALYRQNKITTTDALPCVVLGVGSDLVPGVPLADGWCPAQTGTVGGETYTYRVKPWSIVGTLESGLKRQIEIASSGASDDVSRRVEVVATAREGTGLFGDFSAVGRDRVTISSSGNIGDPGPPVISTNAASNGDIVTEGSGQLCGDAKHGIGQSFSGSQCPGHSVFEEELTLPPVDPGTAWVDNSNSRFFTLDRKRGNVTWDSATRTLTMTGNARLTLGASDKPYSFCRLEMHGSSQLIIAQGAVVTIIFHSPETCGLSGDPVTQINMTGNSTSFVTTSENPYDLRVVMVGSDSIPTKAQITGSNGTEGTIYAPRTDLVVWGSGDFHGAAAGKTLTVGGSGKFLNDDRANQAQLPISLVYQRDRYVECTGGTMPSPPDTAC